MFGPTNTACQLLFWKYSPIFSFLIRPQLVFLVLLGPDLLFLGAGIKFQNFIEIYSYRLSNLVLEVQSYLLNYNFGPFWAFLAIFGPCLAIFGVRVKFKTFLKPSYIVYQLLLWKCRPILLVKYYSGWSGGRVGLGRVGWSDGG